MTAQKMTAQNIDQVVDGLARIVHDAEAAGDRVGFFAALYRQVTVEVRNAIHTGQFDDGDRMNRFDTLFGNRYFDAYDAWLGDRGGPRCWRTTFDLLADANTIIVQHLILGVNAHINFDLAVAAADTSPGAAIQELRHDYLVINDILARVVVAVAKAVDAVSPYMGLLDQLGGRTEDQILDFSIPLAREEAWHNAVILANQNGADREHTIDLLDVRTKALARLIARPDNLVRAAIQLIHSAESTDVPAVINRLDHAVE